MLIDIMFLTQNLAPIAVLLLTVLATNTIINTPIFRWNGESLGEQALWWGAFSCDKPFLDSWILKEKDTPRE